MHRRVMQALTGLAAAGMVIGTTGTSATAHGGGHSAPKHDSIVGNLVNNPNGPVGVLADFQIIAVSKPDGSQFIGGFRVAAKTNPVRQYITVLTCMRVSGNLATVVGKVIWSTDAERPVGSYRHVRLEDLGSGPTTMDKIQLGTYTGDPRVCPDPVLPMREPITSGFLSIVDVL